MKNDKDIIKSYWTNALASLHGNMLVSQINFILTMFFHLFMASYVFEGIDEESLRWTMDRAFLRYKKGMNM